MDEDDVEYTTINARVPIGLANEVDKLIHVDGLFLSRSDVMRYAARVVLLLIKGAKNFEEIKKEVKDKL